MLTRIDHVMICVPDLAQGIAAYTRIGFNVELGGVHPGKGTHNAIAFHQEDYLELLSVHDRAEHRRAVSAPGSLDTGLLDLLARVEMRPGVKIPPTECSRCEAAVST